MPSEQAWDDIGTFVFLTGAVKEQLQMRWILPAGDRAGINRLVSYITRRPFSVSRWVNVTESGQVIYKAEKPGVPADGSRFRLEHGSKLVRQHLPPTAARGDPCRAFPDPQRDELARGPKRNFQVLDSLDLLAEFTQHMPPQRARI